MASVSDPTHRGRAQIEKSSWRDCEKAALAIRFIGDRYICTPTTSSADGAQKTLRLQVASGHRQ